MTACLKDWLHRFHLKLLNFNLWNLQHLFKQQVVCGQVYLFIVIFVHSLTVITCNSWTKKLNKPDSEWVRKEKKDLKPHTEMIYTVRLGSVFQCFFCPFYPPGKKKLNKNNVCSIEVSDLTIISWSILRMSTICFSPMCLNHQIHAKLSKMSSWWVFT